MHILNQRIDRACRSNPQISLALNALALSELASAQHAIITSSLMHPSILALVKLSEKHVSIIHRRNDEQLRRLRHKHLPENLAFFSSFKVALASRPGAFIVIAPGIQRTYRHSDLSGGERGNVYPSYSDMPFSWQTITGRLTTGSLYLNLPNQSKSGPAFEEFLHEHTFKVYFSDLNEKLSDGTSISINTRRIFRFITFTLALSSRETPPIVTIEKHPLTLLPYRGIRVRYDSWQWKRGRLFSTDLKILMKKGRMPLSVYHLIVEWYVFLSTTLQDAKDSGRFVDAIWSNTICENDEFFFIDLEWEIEDSITPQYILFRSIYRFISDEHKTPAKDSIYLLSSKIFFHLNIEFGPIVYMKFIWQDSGFLAAVKNTCRYSKFFTMLAAGIIPPYILQRLPFKRSA